MQRRIRSLSKHCAPLRSRIFSPAFSLVEVAISIAILGFAFVALIGLLPVGMGVFRESVDSANESWIFQSLNTEIQATPWEKIETLGSQSSEIYLYGDDGRLVDKKAPSALGSLRPDQRLIVQFAAKILIAPAKRPGEAEQELPSDTKVATVLICRFNDTKAMSALLKMNRVDLFSAGEVPRNSRLRARSWIITRMDSLPLG